MMPEVIEKYKIGDRVDVSGQRGTVMYIGEVENTEGLWLGIDWDNPARGKHDGTLKGIRYFTARSPTSGSFVRPKNVTTGITIMEGIRSRYGAVDDNTSGLEVEQIVHAMLNMKANVFEVVGVEELSKHLSNLANLQTVVLHDVLVSNAGPPEELKQFCPNITELHLGKTLIANWRTISEIVSQLKRLSLLSVSESRMEIEDDLNPEEFSTLKHVILGKMNYTWDDVLKCFGFIVNVENVQVPFNRVTNLREPPPCTFTRLASLDLEGNLISSWDEINKLGRLDSLQCLNLSDCGIKRIFFPCAEDSPRKTTLFVNLRVLTLSDNLIEDWVYISELDKLRSLVDFRFKDNPVLNRDTMDGNHGLIIAKLSNLTKLNKREISREERNGAECYYWKQYGLEWLAATTEDQKKEFLRKHPCYPRLLEKLGNPEECELKKPSTLLKNELIEVEIFSPNVEEKSYVKKVSVNMSTEKLTGLAQRLFNTGCKIPRLTCIRAEGAKPVEIPLDNNMRSLNFFCVRNGDKISVVW